jgi:hypothetical protein
MPKSSNTNRACLSMNINERLANVNEEQGTIPNVGAY